MTKMKLAFGGLVVLGIAGAFYVLQQPDLHPLYAVPFYLGVLVAAYGISLCREERPDAR